MQRAMQVNPRLPVQTVRPILMKWQHRLVAHLIEQFYCLVELVHLPAANTNALQRTVKMFSLKNNSRCIDRRQW
jgi:hypothetical protein